MCIYNTYIRYASIHLGCPKTNLVPGLPGRLPSGIGPRDRNDIKSQHLEILVSQDSLNPQKTNECGFKESWDTNKKGIQWELTNPGIKFRLLGGSVTNFRKVLVCRNPKH